MLLRRLSNVAPAAAANRSFVPPKGNATLPILAAIRDVGFQMDRFGSRLDRFESRLDRFESSLNRFESRMLCRMDRLGSKMDATEGRLISCAHVGWFRKYDNAFLALAVAGFIALGVVDAMRVREVKARLREQEALHQAELKAIELKAQEKLTLLKTPRALMSTRSARRKAREDSADSHM